MRASHAMDRAVSNTDIRQLLFGFAGALITALIVILLCGFGKFSITKLVLIGLSVNMFAGSVISFLILKNRI